jgi:hypothetical protein
MRRSLPLLCLLAVLLPVAGASAAPGARVAVDECGIVTAKKLTGATFSATMDYLDGADSMSMRFELWSRALGESAFVRVPEADETVKRKAVKSYLYGPRTFVLPDLSGAADYRARVTFRWLDADGRALATERRTSTICRLQAQPNLTLGTLTTTATGQPGTQQYTIPVRNTGRADAGTFDVGLRIGNESRPPVKVTGVAAGATQSVSFVAPRCEAGDVLRFEADPDGRVSEEDERDNVLSVACPTA